MADFWIKLHAGAAAEGPVTSSELKRRAVHGRLPRNAMISRDGVAWHTAAKVKGLFDAPAATAAAATAATATATATAPLAAAPVAPPVVPPPAAVQGQPIGYYAPHTDAPVAIRARSPLVFQIVAALVAVAWAFAFFAAMMGDEPWAALAGVGVMLLLMVPALIFWLVWLYQSHSDMRQLTGGGYSISPEAAVGMSFIPVFSGYWVVYTPYRLAVEANRHLLSRGLKPIPVAAVLGCQIGSVVLAFFTPGLTPAMYGVSMTVVQSGLNRLAKAG